MTPNWEEIKKEYIQSEGKAVLKELAEKYQVKIGTLRSRKSRENWDSEIDNVATCNATDKKKKCNVAKEKEVYNIVNNNTKKEKNRVKDKASKTKSKGPGAPIGNKNSVGNKGGLGGPIGNKHAETHGFFSKYLPNETLELVKEIEEKDRLEILWENITIQYAAIIRAQRIMYVKDQEDITKVIKKEKYHDGMASSSEEKEYEFQFAWDRHATFLQAQSRAMGELRSMIKQYEELVNSGLGTEEQKLRIEKLKQDIEKIKDDSEVKDQVVIIDDI